MTRSTPCVEGCDGPEVEDHGLVLGDLHVDVGRVELHSLGQTQHRARLPAELPVPRLRPGRHLLAALVGLGLEDLGQLGSPGGARPRMRSSRLILARLGSALASGDPVAAARRSAPLSARVAHWVPL